MSKEGDAAVFALMDGGNCQTFFARKIFRSKANRD